MMEIDFRQSARELMPKLVDMRRTLHRFPELAFQEFETTKRIKAWLEEAGVSLLDLDLPTGVLAEVRGSQPGPKVALRADIDSLPVQEETGLDYASQIEGRMHACGHDFHTTSMIGTAILLQKHRDKLKGTVRFLFQPAEEISQGAQKMVEKGALEGVQAIMGMHNKPELPVGTVGISAGPLMASVNRFLITIKGKAGHGAIPQRTIDPVVIASSVVLNLQTVISRMISPLDQSLISVCRLEAGNTWNVIPDQAVLEGTVRTFQPETLERIPGLIRRLIDGICSGYGAEGALGWLPGFPAVNNDEGIANLMKEAASDLGISVVDATPTTAGEDFAVYQERVPGCFIWVGTDGPEEWHHPKFQLNEDAFEYSVSLFARAAQLVLERLK
jgi:amidohydrolase